MSSGLIVRSLLVWGLICGLCFAPVARAQRADPGAVTLDIPSQSAESAVKKLARAYRRSVLLQTNDVEHIASNTVSGLYTLSGALDAMFEGTSLQAHITDSGVITVSLRDVESKGDVELRRSQLYLGAGLAWAMVLNTPAFSQTEQEEPDTVVVVGSQIAGARITGALPVSVVGAEDIEATAAVSGEELFRTLPEAGDVSFNDTFLGGASPNAARGDVSTVSLRGLQEGNTLLLLNGRRVVAHPTTQTAGGTPQVGYNVNTIPVAGLQRVEILKEGAAALYGSDAVAGVINNVLQSDYVGAEVSFQAGSAEGTSLEEYTANALYGTDFAQGRGNISLYFGATHKDALKSNDLDFLATDDLRGFVEGTPFEGATAFDNRSTNTPWGYFQAEGAGVITSNGEPVTNSVGAFHVQPTTNSGCRYVVNDAICYDDGSISGSADRNLRHDAPRAFEDLEASPSVDRFNGFGFLNYDLNARVSAFAEIGYYHAESERMVGAVNPLGSTPIYIPASNYYNPFGPEGSPNRLPGLNIGPEGLPLLIRNYRLVDVGSREVEVTNDQYRFVGGLRGSFGDWDWETAALYNEATVSDTMDGVSNTLFQQALALDTPAAYNPFNGGDPASPSAADATPSDAATIDSFLIKVTRDNRTSLSLWDFKISNADLIALPAGGLGVAAGVEARHEYYEDDRDEHQGEGITYTDMVTGITYGSDLMGASPSPDVDGSRDVLSAYVELAVPVISPDMNVPLIQAIDLQFAGRFEDYNDVGSVAKPKIAGSWDITESLRLRGSWSQGFKAPNLEVLNLGILERSNTRRDNYRCEAELRAGAIDSFAACTASYGVPDLRQGNRDLEPEESESTSFGAVFQPTFLPDSFGDATFTVDRWSIEQTGVIGILSSQQAMDLDYLARLNGSSNPYVVREAATPEDIAAYAGSGLDPVGRVQYVDTLFQNLNPLTVEGVDLGLIYNKSFGQYGDLRLSANATKLTKYYQSPSPDQQRLLDAIEAGELNEGVSVAGAADLIGRDGHPEWKYTLSATWYYGPWTANIMTRFTDAVDDPNTLDADANPFVVESQQTVNLYGQYAFEDGFASGTSVRLGVRNLTDEDPPFADGGYYATLYSPLGRYWYASIKKVF